MQPWLLHCFGAEIAGDQIERNHRFLEEALELVQACGGTQSEAHQLVDYVFGRPAGELAQEVGGVMVTLAALCLAQGLDMHTAGETELARIWPLADKIRAKQAAKPKHSPLPEHTAPQPQQELQSRLDDYATEINRLRNVIQAACTGGTDYMIERWKQLFPDAPVPTVKVQQTDRDCPHCNYSGTVHCGDVAAQIQANGGEPGNCSNAHAYGLRSATPPQAPAPAPQAQAVPAVDSACRRHVWWTHNKSKFTTTKQAAFAAWDASMTASAAQKEPT